jgi:ribosomal protein L7/L12
VGQISELIELIKEKFNIQEQAVVQAAAPAQNEATTEEKVGNVSVKLKGIKEEANKVKIYKELVNIFKEEGKTINLIEAKNLLNKEDKIILEEVESEKVKGEKGFKKRLEDLGLELEIK